jgi:hypothetical protein
MMIVADDADRMRNVKSICSAYAERRRVTSADENPRKRLAADSAQRDRRAMFMQIHSR